MNARTIADFARTKAGVFLIIGFVLACILAVLVARNGGMNTKGKPSQLYVGPNRPANNSAPRTPQDQETGQVTEIRRRTSGTGTVVAAARSTPPPVQQPVAQSAARPVATPPPGPPLKIGLFDSPLRPSPSPADPRLNPDLAGNQTLQPAVPTPIPIRPISEEFAPFGSMLKCKTVFTVDSSNSETPVVGLVTENLYHNGFLIIPAGTQVHGTASSANLLPERIPTSDHWVLVLPTDKFGERPNGSELNIKGVALDRAEKGTDGRQWSVEDGAYGLKGFTISSNSANQIRKFLATFISAGAAGLQTTQQQGGGLTGYTSVVATTPRNAALGGLTAVMADEAARIQREIEAHGSYTRVPGGTPFYLYVQQTLDVHDARVGESYAYANGGPQFSGRQANQLLREAVEAQRVRPANYPYYPEASQGYPPPGFVAAPQFPNGTSSTVPVYAQPGRPGYTYRYETGVTPSNPPTSNAGGPLPLQ